MLGANQMREKCEEKHKREKVLELNLVTVSFNSDFSNLIIKLSNFDSFHYD